MDWSFHPMREQWARQIAAWHYDAPYSMYDCGDAAEFLNGDYTAVLSGGALAGFYCTGASARVAGYDYDGRAIDFGLGMNPALTGRGLGRDFVGQIAAQIERTKGASALRLTVAAFNRRAIKVYMALGFDGVDAFAAPNGRRFFVMARSAARWIDLTRPLWMGMPVYPGDPPFERETFDDGTYRVSTIRMSAHCGIHIDAPAHCLPDGATVDQIAPEALCGVALVLKADQIKLLSPAVSRLLIQSPRGISLRQAEALIALGARLVGVEGQSIASGDEEIAVHRALLRAGVVIVENLDLSGVSGGAYELFCLPLSLRGAEAAPVRAMARRLYHIDGKAFFG